MWSETCRKCQRNGSWLSGCVWRLQDNELATAKGNWKEGVLLKANLLFHQEGFKLKFEREVRRTQIKLYIRRFRRMKGMAQNSSSQVWVIQFSVGLIVVQLKQGLVMKEKWRTPGYANPIRFLWGGTSHTNLCSDLQRNLRYKVCPNSFDHRILFFH